MHGAYSIKAFVNVVQVEQHYVTEFVFGVNFYLSQRSNLP